MATEHIAMGKSQSAFVVSLDFELHWGICDRENALTDYRPNLERVREVIPRLLDVFEAFEIRATWATVGFLFYKSKEEMLEHLPEMRPGYVDRKLSAYEYLDLVGDDERDDPLHFAPSLIEEIKRRQGQHVGSHTHSHFYCLEKGQHKEAFEADIEKAVEIAGRRGIEVESLVFPRNQLNPDYIPILEKHGIVTYRGNPPAWMYEAMRGEEATLAHRGFRLLDAYLPVRGLIESKTATNGKGLPAVNIPATRFLRPYFPTLRGLEAIRLRRIKGEMREAARDGRVYHLWWHPHNFGSEMDANFQFLRRILEYRQELDERYGMPSLSMEDTVREEAEAPEASV